MSAGNAANVRSYQVLAEILGVSEKTIRRWKSDIRFAHSAPEVNADQTHNVKAWQTFMRSHGLGPHEGDVPAGHELNTGEGAVEFPAGTLNDWRCKEIEAKVKGLELRNSEAAGALLVAAELEQPLGAFLTAIQNLLVSFPERAAQRVRGLTDVHEIEDILREEIEGRQRMLSCFDVEKISRAVAIDLPFDPETTRLYGLVTFAGQDDRELRKLVWLCVLESLRRIGAEGQRAAIAPVARVAPLPAEPVEDEA